MRPAELRQITDPVERLRATLTTRKQLQEDALRLAAQLAAPEMAELSEIVAAAIEEAKTEGLTGPQVAKRLGISHQRLYQLIGERTGRR